MALHIPFPTEMVWATVRVELAEMVPSVKKRLVVNRLPRLFTVQLKGAARAHGRYFWQNDKPHEEHNMWKVVENGIAIATDAIKNLEYSEIAERFKLKEKLEAARDNADHIEKVIEDYFDEVWKSYDEKMHQNFPVFRGKVYPLLKEFDDNFEEMLKHSLTELVPVTTDFFSGLGSEFKKFWDNFANIAEKSRDKLRADVDDVRVKIQPYADDVKAEYEKYKEGMKTDFEEKTKNVKEEVEKDLEELREKLKPYLENARKQLVPHAKDMQKKIDKLIREIHAYFTSDNKN
ncbi:uncharacterized protein ACMZJ9_018924 [Mantella aurantiaca]